MAAELTDPQPASLLNSPPSTGDDAGAAAPYALSALQIIQASQAMTLAQQHNIIMHLLFCQTGIELTIMNSSQRAIGPGNNPLDPAGPASYSTFGPAGEFADAFL